MDPKIASLLEKLGIETSQEDLYELAFIHKSMNGYAGTRHVDYERLEFLGDSVINLAVAELCYTSHPSMSSGDLSKLRAQFICTASEAEYARQLGLAECVQVGPSLDKAAAQSDNILEDVFESFLGALYLDKGVDFVISFLRGLLSEKVSQGEIRIEMNPKSTLQEAVQGDHRGALTYTVIRESGQPNNKTFVVAVYLDGQELGRGVGKSKKMAETAAANDALSKMAV